MKQRMDIQKVFHMKGGNGDHSYSNNSSLQKRVADKVKHITLQAMEETLEATRTMSLGIADLGCSSGPNTLSNVKQLVQTVERACSTTRNTKQQQQQQLLLPEFRVYLNDLPTNDFNTIFQALPDLYRDLNKPPNNNINHHHHQIYIAGYPGTFYGRLFPDNCLHFVYSSNSLHWLSTVPEGIFDDNGLSINKKSIYISERSPVQVSEAYLKQFREDFSLFLKSRSRELVAGGRMVLILLGRRSADDLRVDTGNSFFWEILYQSLATLVHQGEIEEEKLESYEVHFYAPSKEELEEEVRKEGSFKVELVEMFEMDKDIIDASGNSNNNIYPSYGVAVAKTVRSIQESMIASHFGESIDLDKLFDLYGRLVDQELAKHEDDDDDDEDMIRSITTVLVLTKL